jgi:hypothetical protein
MVAGWLNLSYFSSQDATSAEVASPLVPSDPPLGTDFRQSVYSTMTEVDRCLAPATLTSGPATRIRRAQIAGIAHAVEDLRGLDYRAPVKREFLSPAALSRRVAGNLNMPSPKKVRFETRLLASLGIVDPDIDLLKLGKKFASQRVAGFYIPKKKKLVVPRTKAYLRPYDELIVAHELEHALADQQLGLPRLNAKDPARGDEMLAKRALVEGDATLIMQQYLANALDPTKQQRVFEQMQEESDPPDKAPYALEKSFSFPYDEGTLFVCDLLLHGGWDAVNEAYENPPVSTSQILFPNRYRDGIEPLDPIDPPGLPSGWKRGDTYALGMADLMWMFAAPQGKEVQPPSTLVNQVSRWHGGEIHSWRKGSDIAMVVGLVDGGDAMEMNADVPRPLCSLMAEWMTMAFPESKTLAEKKGYKLEVNRLNFTVRTCTEEGVRLGFTSDRSIARRWMGTLGS